MNVKYSFNASSSYHPKTNVSRVEHWTPAQKNAERKMSQPRHTAALYRTVSFQYVPVHQENNGFLLLVLELRVFDTARHYISNSTAEQCRPASVETDIDGHLVSGVCKLHFH